MKNKKCILIIPISLFLLTVGMSSLKSQEIIECKWSMVECHRVTDVNGITYVYHGEKVEQEQN